MAMEKIYRYFDRTADNLCRYAHLVKNPGLMNGKMGIALFLYRCGRLIDKPACELIAGELVDEALERLSLDDPIDFDSGLCGIGYGVDYLIKNHYVEAESTEILEELNAHIASVTKKEDIGNKQLLSAAKYWLKRGNRELFDENITRFTQSLTKAVEIAKTQQTNIEAYIIRNILTLLLFYAGIDREPGKDVRNLYEYMTKSDFMAGKLRVRWSDRYVLNKIHNLFGNNADESAGSSAQEDEIRLADLLRFRDYNMQCGFKIPIETHSKIQQLLNDEDLLEEWITLALPATMHINGYMAGFGWILLDSLDAQNV
jgi:hypothetical protein